MKKFNTAVIRAIFARFVLMPALLFGLSGCGQSGPLYLPDNPPKSQKTSK